MGRESRTGKAKINSITTLATQFCQIILGFALRKIFINTLGMTYLGYNSVFANILQMLNLADLGIGVAITSFLFKPLAEDEKERVSALMHIYKKIYSIIGAVVLILGIIISFFLEVLIPDANCSIGYLRVLFFINLAGTVSTYFLAYKRTLLIADQKSYITNLVDTIMYFAVSALQIVLLFTVPNYIIYLVLQIAKNIISNIILSIRADREYGKIDRAAKKEIVEEYKPQIVKYVKDVFISRIGATVYYSTDNVILSIFKGSLLTGFLSNYTLITTQLTTVVNQVLASLQATFGNYVHSGKSKAEQSQMTENYFCVNFLIGNFCFLCFSLLAQSFIKLFFGQSLVLNYSTAIWLGINLMLTMLLQLPSQVFIIYKLFNYDKPIIAVSAFLNIVISVALVKPLGIDGVLIGTFITSLIYLFSRFYIIGKHVYKISFLHYIKRIGFYFATSAACFLAIYYSCNGLADNSIADFIVRAVLIGSLAVFLPATVLSFTKEFRFLIDKLVPEKARRFCTKRSFGTVSAVAVIAAIVIGRVL